MIWLILIALLGLAWGWARWFTAQTDTPSPFLLSLCLAIAFCFGTLSLVMLWLGLLRLPITAWLTTLIYLALTLPGWWLARHHLFPPIPTLLDTTRLHRLTVLCLLAICAAILFNAVQWPFYRDDTLGIYVPFAQEIATTHALAPITNTRQLYELYPQLISMNYAYVFMVTDWHNPYPAKFIATVLSLACLPALYLLTQAIFSTRAAWFAVALLALTPDFGNWASSGYVDLPMAFFYIMGVFFAWKLPQTNRATTAICAGLMFGLATWTKNAALLSTVIFLVYLLYHLMQRQLTLKTVVIACAALGIIAAPWYLRNVWLVGSVTPATVWTDNARQTIREVFILIALPQNYGLPGWVLLSGVFWGLWQVVNRTRYTKAVVFSLLWSVPYYLTWFLFASYDPRFVLLFLPFLATLGGAALSTIWEPTQYRRMPYGAILVVILITLTISTLWDSVEYKRALLRQPLMSHDVKVDVVSNREQ